MATGQTLLTLASIVLLGIISMSIQQMYVQSVDNSVDAQYTSDALNFGRNLSERIQSYSKLYGELENDFGDFDDVTEFDSRIEFNAPAGETFYATIEISAEQVLMYDQVGRKVTIRVFEEENDNYQLKAEYVTAVVNMPS